jgi:hypothetical protein
MPLSKTIRVAPAAIIHLRLESLLSDTATKLPILYEYVVNLLVSGVTAQPHHECGSADRT